MPLGPRFQGQKVLARGASCGWAFVRLFSSSIRLSLHPSGLIQMVCGVPMGVRARPPPASAKVLPVSIFLCLCGPRPCCGPQGFVGRANHTIRVVSLFLSLASAGVDLSLLSGERGRGGGGERAAGFDVFESPDLLSIGLGRGGGFGWVGGKVGCGGGGGDDVCTHRGRQRLALGAALSGSLCGYLLLGGTLPAVGLCADLNVMDPGLLGSCLEVSPSLKGVASIVQYRRRGGRPHSLGSQFTNAQTADLNVMDPGLLGSCLEVSPSLKGVASIVQYRRRG
ncbi:Hypothetical predicted protein [Marmota monax]|uniref:Uncharacterized protein n=1 Tax=Marmota monax TaxID=9995 RepID=A0A5E4B8W7_MARMO|nr:Hypothetical predicted protein [Marmota monax]